MISGYHPSRFSIGKIRILLFLFNSEDPAGRSFGDIVAGCGLSAKNTSKHLKTLLKGGFVRKVRNGRNSFYTITEEGVKVLKSGSIDMIDIDCENDLSMESLRSLFEGKNLNQLELKALERLGYVVLGVGGNVRITGRGKEVLKRFYVQELKRVVQALEKLGVRVKRRDGSRQESRTEPVAKSKSKSKSKLKLKSKLKSKAEVDAESGEESGEAGEEAGEAEEVKEVEEAGEVEVGSKSAELDQEPDWKVYCKKIAGSFDLLRERLKERATFSDGRLVIHDPPYVISVLPDGCVFFDLEVGGEEVAALTRDGLRISVEECAEDVEEEVREWCVALAAIVGEPFNTAFRLAEAAVAV